MRTASNSVLLLLILAMATEAADRGLDRRRTVTLSASDSRTSQTTFVRPASFASGLAFDWADGDQSESPDDANADEKPKVNYGPPPEVDRKTLFQWSYGTSFEGGVDDELETDRPDFTEASTTVGNGVLQIESGYTYVRDDSTTGNFTLHSAGEVLIRYGILVDWLEFRLGLAPFSSTANGIQINGVDDLYLGFKIGLTPQEGIWPEMALMPQMTVPSGSRAVTANRVLAGLNWLYGWDIDDDLSVGGSTQFNSSLDGMTGDVYTEWAQSVTVNYSLAKKLGSYVEWFAFFPHGADTEQPEHYIDGGLTYKLSPDVQFDVRGGFGLTESASDYFVGTGLSLRFK